MKLSTLARLSEAEAPYEPHDFLGAFDPGLEF